MGGAARHDAAERVPHQDPPPHGGEPLPHAVGPVRVEHGQVERHGDDHTEKPAIGQVPHERRVRLGLHLASGVENDPGPRVAGNEGDVAALQPLHGHGVGRLHGGQGRIIRVIVVAHVDAEAYGAGDDDRENGHQDDLQLAVGLANGGMRHLAREQLLFACRLGGVGDVRFALQGHGLFPLGRIAACVARVRIVFGK